MIWLETLFALLSQYLLMPVLIAIGVSLLYVIYSSGVFCAEYYQRFTSTTAFNSLITGNETPCTETLELRIIKRLETLRLVSRTAPMLGLVATMIPLGPALTALGEGDLSAMGKDMALAFSAVIVALAAASGAYWISTVRRRWLLNELHHYEQTIASVKGK